MTKDETTKEILEGKILEALSNILLGEKIPLDVVDSLNARVIIPCNRKITKTLLRQMVKARATLDIDPSPIRNKVREILAQFDVPVQPVAWTAEMKNPKAIRREKLRRIKPTIVPKAVDDVLPPKDKRSRPHRSSDMLDDSNDNRPLTKGQLIVEARTPLPSKPSAQRWMPQIAGEANPRLLRQNMTIAGTAYERHRQLMSGLIFSYPRSQRRRGRAIYDGGLTTIR